MQRRGSPLHRSAHGGPGTVCASMKWRFARLFGRPAQRQALWSDADRVDTERIVDLVDLALHPVTPRPAGRSAFAMPCMSTRCLRARHPTARSRPSRRRHLTAERPRDAEPGRYPQFSGPSCWVGRPPSRCIAGLPTSAHAPGVDVTPGDPPVRKGGGVSKNSGGSPSKRPGPLLYGRPVETRFWPFGLQIDPQMNVPKHLRAPTRAWFKHVAENFELEQHHFRLLQLAAEAWDRAEEARQALAKYRLTFVDRFGSPRARPEIGIERDSRIAFARLIRELDLDVEPPTSSSRPALLRSNRRT